MDLVVFSSPTSKYLSIKKVKIFLILLAFFGIFFYFIFSFFYNVSPNVYVLYDSKNDKWNEIDMVFPHPKMGESAGFMIMFSLENTKFEDRMEFAEKYKEIFLKELPEKLEIQQTREEAINDVFWNVNLESPIELGYFLVPTGDAKKQEEKHVQIRLNGKLNFDTKKLPGDIWIVERIK